MARIKGSDNEFIVFKSLPLWVYPYVINNSRPVALKFILDILDDGIFEVDEYKEVYTLMIEGSDVRAANTYFNMTKEFSESHGRVQQFCEPILDRIELRNKPLTQFQFTNDPLSNPLSYFCTRVTYNTDTTGTVEDTVFLYKSSYLYRDENLMEIRFGVMPQSIFST